MLPEDDVTRLRHMLDAADHAIAFSAGRERDDLEEDAMLLFALVRAIEIIGEAAAHVGDEGRAALPDLPWPSIVGMRHRLIHAYFSVDPDRVWDVVTNELPPLIAVLERVLAQGDAARQPGA